MVPKIYKSKYDYKKLEEMLMENDYKKIGEEKKYTTENVRISLFFEIHEKNIPDWVIEVMKFFGDEENYSREIPMQYNAIIIVRTKKSIYLLPKGRAFWQVEKLADLDFGLNFAEKAIESQEIVMKSVSFIQRNMMRGVMNYKKNQNEFPQASESYSYVSGKPISETIYGKSIDCGTGVTFPRNYELNNSKSIRDFCNLFNEIDITLSLKDRKSNIPRLRNISKKEKLYSQLNDSLLSEIKTTSSKDVVAINISRIQIVDNSINISTNNQSLGIYIRGEKRETEEKISLTGTEVVRYIKERTALISNLEQINFAIYDDEGQPIKSNFSFKQLIYAEIEINNKVYVLDSGKWGYFNNKFYETLEEKLIEIDSIVEFDNEYSISYDSHEKGELSGEGGYIEKLTENADMIKLHKRNLNVSGATIEVADIYNKKSNELLAIKRGMDTSTAMYSFEQSLLSIQILTNKEEFQVRKELLKYNNRKKYENVQTYPNIREGMVKKIIDCKNASVLWLIGDKPIYVFDGVRERNFKLSQINSIMLKLKIVDWYLFTKDSGYVPKLYFAFDKSQK
ncbi:DUF6119 family protein [Marinilactibacillus kalidii]|uniref:DUF6119 family protein n=1 Tax=Marinilactibacillus kalidii TaxID=2820274 RepID=UPI001ABE3181|nr:DUF6119 family protein [Marinilactibacillus kalidii]